MLRDFQSALLFKHGKEKFNRCRKTDIQAVKV
jgi:hypothetical protein